MLLLSFGPAIFPYVSVDWNAGSYHRIAGPMEEMGLTVLERLELRGDETVLDAGCGTGRVTAALCELLPRGRVIAVDRAPSMVARAKAFLGDSADVREADLLELELEEPVDAVVSTATFHWILDHERLFARLHAVLRPGGTLVAQCGGDGNIERLLAAASETARDPRFAPSFDGWTPPHRFETAEATAGRLSRAGFTDVRCWLAALEVRPDDPVEYLRTIPLRTHLERLPPERHDPFLGGVIDRLGEPVVLDYVRLNIDARRPA